MLQITTALIAGLVFGIGLILAGMTDPSKIIGFLDIAGAWNPSLAFVMGGAILVGLVAFRFAGKRTQSFLGAAILMPSATHIDRRLVVGGLAFGIGWGLAGYCPGPVLASLVTGAAEPVVFTLAMLAGMGVFELLDRTTRARKVRAA